MNISRLLNSKYSKYILSFIIGIGLATLFRRVCNKKNCLTFKAPKPEELENKQYEFDDKCYSYEKHAVSCNKNKKIVEF